MKFKRLLASFFAATMCFSMLPAVVSADEVDQSNSVAIVEVAAKDTGSASSSSSAGVIQEGTFGSFSFVLDGSGSLKISGKGAMPNFKTAPWRANASKIKKVVLAKNITSIGNYAFVGTTNLTSISIPSSIKTIGKSAFYKSGLKKVSGGAGLTSIGQSAFSGCSSLSSFSISSKKLSKIGAYAFKGTKIKTLNITKTTKLKKKNVKKSLKGSKITKVNVKSSKKITYGVYFVKSNSGRKVKVY